MNSQVSNMMSIDDHVDKINEAKNKVQNGIFDENTTFVGVCIYSGLRL